MIKGIESIIVFSEDAKALADFYKDKIGLKLTLEAEIGEGGERLFGFEFNSGVTFYVVDHSKVHGKNTQPERIIFNLEVDNIEKEVARLDEAKIEKVQDIYHIENYGLISTYKDTDGNFFQLVQIKA